MLAVLVICASSRRGPSRVYLGHITSFMHHLYRRTLPPCSPTSSRPGRLHEKGGRYNVVPAHHTAQAYVDAYLEAAGIGEDRRGPLFRSCKPGRRDALQDRAMSRLSALKMIKRRARQAGLPADICAHSFRGTGIAEYLRNGGDLEVAARIAGHESTRTTQLYNRLNDEISLDEIERIHI